MDSENNTDASNTFLTQGLKTRRKNKTRINAGYLLLQYYKVPDYWTKEFMASSLIKKSLLFLKGPMRGKTRVVAWAICEEFNREGGKNFYCFFELIKNIDIKSLYRLNVRDDYECNSTPKYRGIINPKNTLEFITKHKDWIGEGFPGMADMTVIGELKKKVELLENVESNRLHSIDEALKAIKRQISQLEQKIVK